MFAFSQKNNFNSNIKSKNRALITSVAAATLLINALAPAYGNEWTGAYDDDLFNPQNWDDAGQNGTGPQGSSSVFNNGTATGVITSNPLSNIAANIGSNAGDVANLTIEIKTQNDPTVFIPWLNFGSDVEIGSGGGSGTLTIDADGSTNINLIMSNLSIGKNTGSVGVVNLIGTGKQTNTAPENSININPNCYTCGTTFIPTLAQNGDIKIGIAGGSGTLNLDGSALIYMTRQEFIVGDGTAGAQRSQGTLNVLAGGKLGDGFPSTYNNFTAGNSLSRGKFTVGINGGDGVVNIDGRNAPDRNSAPLAVFGQGLVIGNGTANPNGTGVASTGAINVLSKGKVHAFINNEFGSYIQQNEAVRSVFDTRLGINGGHGTLRVSGDGAVWYQSGLMGDSLRAGGVSSIISDAGTIHVGGENGTGELIIADKGQVRIGSATLQMNADATVTLSNHVSNGTLILGDAASGSGVLSIGGGVGEAAVAAGRLMAKTVQFGPGTGLIRFNHTENNYIFDQFSDQFGTGPATAAILGITGAGTIDAAAGRTLLNADHLDFTGLLQPSTGILQVNGDISSAKVNVLAGGTLEGTGKVGATVNSGILAPGQTPNGIQGQLNSIGTLTIAGNYTGNNGLLLLDTVLGGDASLTDKLNVEGDTAGSTKVRVINVGGTGAQTVNGIEVITVTGESSGSFALENEYVVAGAYAYRLHKGSKDGDELKNWYLRSELNNTDDPEYQPGSPVYEAYPQALLAMNGVSTLQQRVGNRVWSGKGNQVIAQGADAITPYASPEEAGALVEGNGVWGRMEGGYNHFESRYSTSGTGFNQNTFKMQAGIDGVLSETENSKLLGSITAHYIHGKTTTKSTDYVDGDISTDGYGFGGALTWYGNEGLYVDGQAQLTWYRSDLTTSALNAPVLADGNKGFGYALSLETGKRYALDGQYALTPQAQLVYSSVDFDDFIDGFGAAVSLDRGRSLQGRLGLALEKQNSWQNAKGMTNRSNIYGIANMYYEFMNGTKVDVQGVSFANKQDALWGGLGVGGSYNWNNDQYSIYGEGLVNTSLSNLGDSYSLKGQIGFRVKW